MTGRGGQDRTPGQEALREAARLEAARVYGRVCVETTQPISVTAVVAEAESAAYRLRQLEKAVREMSADGLPASEIMAVTGADYATVHRLRKAG